MLYGLKIKLYFLGIILFFNVNVFAQSSDNQQFVGVWVATVKMLDYPSRRGLNSYQLKREFIEILDSCVAVGANNLFFQIRPEADAFYDSPYEPWSEWLTGQQGKAPSPYFDPLEFMITETHKRGLKFHAWINPFRAVATYQSANVLDNHITKQHPEWFFNYGSNKYFDPGIPQVQDYIIKIIVDVVKRYNVDGIHFDDYFYPYPIKNSSREIIEIPDYQTFRKYNNGFTDIKFWRRDNINRFIERVHDTIKSINPEVEFGVSPCGVWRNISHDADGSKTRGLAAYDWIYADDVKWLKNKWVDYLAPQLYWNIGNTYADFETLAEWWNRHAFGVDLYVGLNIYAIDATRKKPSWGNPNQIPRQIRIAQSYPAFKGVILYRYSTLKKNPLGINDSLRSFYVKPETVGVAVNDTILLDTNLIVLADTNIMVEDLNVLAPPVNLSKYNIQSEITLMWDYTADLDSVKYFKIYKFKGKQIGKLDSNSLFLTSKDNYVRFDKRISRRLFVKKYTFIVTILGINNIESLPSTPIIIRLK